MDNTREGKPTKGWQSHLEEAVPLIIKVTHIVLLTLVALKFIIHEIKNW